MKCKFCGSSRLVKNGTRERRYRGEVKRFRCKDCNRQTLIAIQPPNKMRFSDDVIAYAVQLFESASLRDIKEAIKRKFAVRVSHVSIANWIKKFYIARIPSSVPCYHCLFMEALKARGCKPEECDRLEGYLMETEGLS